MACSHICLSPVWDCFDLHSRWLDCHPSLSSIPLRSVSGLALVGGRLLGAPGSDAGADVLHARDASLPPVPGQAGRSPGGPAVPARARRLARGGVCQDRGRYGRPGDAAHKQTIAANQDGKIVKKWQTQIYKYLCNMRYYCSPLSIHEVGHGNYYVHNKEICYWRVTKSTR